MQFLSLCYHYVRDTESTSRFPRILGNSEDEFRKHIEMLKRRYHPLSLEEVRAFYSEGRAPEIVDGKFGLLFTFDDGLSDHYRAAKILAENGIKAVFFIPTCILADRLPANPQIIHYTLAHHGITHFLDAYHTHVSELGLDESFRIRYTRGDNAFATIAEIKKKVKYTLPPKAAREILLKLYDELLLSKFPTMLDEMHLNEEQIREMLSMGHSIGTHTRTHVSITSLKLCKSQANAELIEPKDFLERTFGTRVDAFSYPFGGKEDCFAANTLAERTSGYRFAFTVEHIVNTGSTDPYGLGRYEPYSSDTTRILGEKLLAIEQRHAAV